jgi:hypothetical protein
MLNTFFLFTDLKIEKELLRIYTAIVLAWAYLGTITTF